MERTQAAPHAERTSCPGCGAQLAASHCDACGSARAPGGLVTEKLLAQGPRGRVYLGERAGDGRVAVEELVFTLAPTVKQIEDFEREARLLATLDHPGIPRFLGHFREGEGVHLRLYNVQQHVAGTPLDRLAERGALEPARVKEIAAQLLEILDYLHTRTPPVVHRDVKAANVILRPDGKVALVDFGVAREVRPGGTHGGTMVGTFGYMPPEQLGGTASPSGDLYALGATLLHLLTGKHPELLLVDGLELKLDKVLLTHEWRFFLSRLVARRPEERFASARAALDALAQWRRSPAKRRSPKQAAVLGAVAMALAAGGAVAVYLGPPGALYALWQPAIERKARAEALKPGYSQEKWEASLQTSEDKSAKVLVLSMGSLKRFPVRPLEPATENKLVKLVTDENWVVRTYALRLVAESDLALGVRFLDPALKALDMAEADNERAAALTALTRLFRSWQGRNSYHTEKNVAPLERLMFDPEAKMQFRVAASLPLVEIFPLPPALLNRLRAQMREPGPMARQCFEILQSHYRELEVSDAGALEMTKAASEYERRLGMLLLASRFPGYKPGQDRLRELAETAQEEALRAEARALLERPAP
ncbi:MAG: serine/threonine-protein kinase [Myxococcales bacterium]